MIQQYYCKEKSDAGHSNSRFKGLKENRSTALKKSTIFILMYHIAIMVFK